MLKRWLGSWFASEPQQNFNNYIAVIIGACNPIGQAIALKCVIDECINIAIVDIEQKSLSLLQKQLKSKSKFGDIKIESFCIENLNDMDQINHLISCIKKTFNTNSIQFLFNNIDCLLSCNDNHDIPSILTSDSSNNDNKRLQEMMNCNFWNTLYLTRSFLPLLISQENIERNRKCYIVNTASLKSAFSVCDSMYSVTKYCVHALSEIMQYEINDILESKKLQFIDNRNPELFDLKLKILCPGFVEKNDDYNLVNLSYKYDKLQSIENVKKIIKYIEISLEEFGKIVFDGIRNNDIFVIQSHQKIFRIFSADKLISMYKPEEKRQHIFTKQFYKSILSKL